MSTLVLWRLHYADSTTTVFARPEASTSTGERCHLEALISSAREHNLVAMGLSVEMDNDAGRLYERFGFQQVGKMGESLTMLLHL